MNLCSKKHDEVCYEGRECPVCELQDRFDTAIENWEKRVTELQDEIDNLDENKQRIESEDIPAKLAQEVGITE